MANSFTVLYRGAAATSSTTLYTVPASTQTLVTTFIITNTAATAATYTITVGGVDIAKDASVQGNDTTIIEFKTLLDAADVIAALASATTVNFHVTGLEIS